MIKLWKSYISWSDCDLLNRTMNIVQEEIIKALIQGMEPSGKLKNDNQLRINMIELQKIIERIREKDDSSKRNQGRPEV